MQSSSPFNYVAAAPFQLAHLRIIRLDVSCAGTQDQGAAALLLPLRWDYGND